MVILSNLGLVEDCASPNRLLNSKSSFLQISNELTHDKTVHDTENPVITEESSSSDPSDMQTDVEEYDLSMRGGRAKTLSWTNFAVDFHSSVGPAKMKRLAELE